MAENSTKTDTTKVDEADCCFSEKEVGEFYDHVLAFMKKKGIKPVRGLMLVIVLSKYIQNKHDMKIVNEAELDVEIIDKPEFQA